MSKTLISVATMIATLFAQSQKAISEKLSSDEFATFSAEVKETHDRLEAQQQGNEQIKADLEAEKAKASTAESQRDAAKADLKKAQDELATAQARITELEPKATQWDAYQASLKGEAGKADGTTPAKPKNVSADADQARIDDLRSLKAKHPSLLEDLELPDAD